MQWTLNMYAIKGPWDESNKEEECYSRVTKTQVYRVYGLSVWGATVSTLMRLRKARTVNAAVNQKGRRNTTLS